ncbi:C6 transcription factor [Purpureocillium lavendulum]|uniref:C6 transcription factor n=1 Tax=Purpureocillium lavendulum TaxID=1247861 RepID=A0AB34G2U4_9HYPO|nr:C6 transcription factor [Purpureocillium lavendulum]
MSRLSGDIPVLPPIPLASMPVSPPKAQEPGGSKPKPQPPQSPTGDYKPHGGHPKVPRHRFLSPAEWNIIANGVGGVQDAEGHRSVRPGRAWFPAANMPPGLYRDIVQERNKYFLLYHAASITQAALMVLQLLIGASVTSLGAMRLHTGIPITVLGAVNTVIAGLIALLDNGGLPDRFRYDMTQFEELEDHMKELLDSGIVPANMTTDQVLAECFDRFREAKATVAANLPVNYNSRSNQQPGGDQASPAPAPLPPVSSPVAPAPPAPAKPSIGGGEDHEAPKTGTKGGAVSDKK